jgi:shikimate 5-dehydrogenase/3-dehydroquinate dehydratase
MNPRPRLVVTLPARSIPMARAQAAEAAKAGADLIEIRLDRWPEEERRRLGQLFPTPVPAIATIRSRTEGGEGPNAPAQRAGLLAEATGFPFAHVDFELARDRPIPTTGGSSPSRWIGSRHFPVETSLDVLDQTVARSAVEYGFVKVVVPASISRFLNELLPSMARWVNPRTAVFTTGASGPLGRIWARHLGQPMVFAALPDAIRPSEQGPVEVSQVPVDQLHRSWSGGEDRRFAVVGAPISHSLSPAIHAGWLASERRPATFVALDVVTEPELVALSRPSPDLAWAGWSVTAPWKAAAAKLAGRRSEAVQATGVANTLTFDARGISADLTDATAVRRRALELVGEGTWDGAEALVIGTGGSARAAVFALGPGRRVVRLLGRRPEAVAAVARDVGGRPADLADPHPVGLIVNATTVGRAGSGVLEPGLSGWVGPGTTLLDFVYAAEEPGLRQACEAQGGRYEDGRRLLVYQAADAHGLWWGESPNDEALAAALRRVGCTA